MAWQNGRQLASITNAAMSASYTYGLDGIRVSKTVNGTSTEFYWQNGLLQGQRTGNDSLLFLYNAGGTAYGMICKTGDTESTYYYLFNAQGDVIALLDSAGNCVAEYLYDEWGKLLSVTGSLADTIGLLNPIRYRGYYYDSETGFYYLHSRYYDPEIGRFINADGQLTAGGDLTELNLFAYCGNNPVNTVDPCGNYRREQDAGELPIIGNSELFSILFVKYIKKHICKNILLIQRFLLIIKERLASLITNYW